jgi:hypothetical protein
VFEVGDLSRKRGSSISAFSAWFAGKIVDGVMAARGERVDHDCITACKPGFLCGTFLPMKSPLSTQPN